ncbi:hypothetical protein N8788_04230 [Candidatus Pelagibacter sp.]|nr:hypothetical protein [Candidatus Pelagibacter sp.]
MKRSSQPNHAIKTIPIINTNYLFIDGMSRSGKTSIAPVISSFKRVEHFKVRATFDRFLMMYESGDLSKQGFKYLFESDLLMDIWFSMMGRDVNNNHHDLTSVLNSPKREEYLARAKKKDTPNTFDEIVKEIKERQLIFPFVCDDFMTSGTLLSEISQNFKYIVVMRNPIDMLFTWFRSGRGTRLGTDPRYTNPAFKIKDFDNVHYSMLDNAEEYNKANSLEKCFLVIEKQMVGYMNADLVHSSNTCLVPIENYWIETEKYIKKFEIFLSTSRTEFTNDEMSGANVPRKKDIDTFSTKANMILDNINEKYSDRLKILCQRYETEISDVYKLSSITKSPKGKFKDLGIDAFSQISSASEFNRGKRISKK